MHCDWLKAVLPELDGDNPRTQGLISATPNTHSNTPTLTQVNSPFIKETLTNLWHIFWFILILLLSISNISNWKKLSMNQIHRRIQ